MSFGEILKLAFSAIWAHKLRSALTLLGMIIGVTAVVVVVSLIQGFNAYVDEKIANIGAKSFSVYRFDFTKDFRDTDVFSAAQRRNKQLTLEDYEFLRAKVQLVDNLGVGVAPSSLQVRSRNESLDAIQVNGTSANMADINKLDTADGRYFNEAENEA